VDELARSPLFTHPGDLTEPIFGVVPLVIALVAMGICVVGLVRGRLAESTLAVGIVGLPLLAFALANTVLLDRSKETEFCESCHLMVPIGESTRADDGSLASFHVSHGAVPTAQSCYGCHSGYGMWGDLNAKLSGVEHMVHTVLGSYELPLRLYRPYNIDSCLACHAESKRFRDVEVHATAEIQEALLSSEMSCTGMCHPAAHPPEALSGNGQAR
jgi:cytochrome c nitrite reductase small subunit